MKRILVVGKINKAINSIPSNIEFAIIGKIPKINFEKNPLMFYNDSGNSRKFIYVDNFVVVIDNIPLKLILVRELKSTDIFTKLSYYENSNIDISRNFQLK